MTTISEIITYITQRTGHPLNRDEGLQHGSAERDVTNAAVCWMASPEAIAFAGARGCQLLIGHESLYFPYDVLNASNPPPGWQDWQVNRQRREALERFGLTFGRIHGSADELTIFDDFAARLELGAPVFTDGLVKVFEIAPTPLITLAAQVKARLGMAALRLSPAGDRDRLVRRVGLPWGGLGLFVNVSYQQRLVEFGCDVFIAGESDNYGMRFAAECGIPMIETSHEISENDGLARFTQLLAGAFPQVEFQFFGNQCVWEVV